MFTLVTTGECIRLDDLNDVLRIARADEARTHQPNFERTYPRRGAAP